MLQIVELLKFWNVKAVCIGGGGEALLNPVTYDLIEQLVSNNICYHMFNKYAK